MGTILNIMIALFAFSFVVFFHELCHFLMAKYLKIEAKEFSVGFGKSVFVYQDKKIHFWPNKEKGIIDENKMSFHLKILPFGGYVLFDRPQIVDNKAVEGDYLNSFHPFKRILVLLAGPLGNLMLGLALFFVFFVQQVDTGPTNEIQEITAGSYAEEIGLKEGDVLLQVNEKGKYHIEHIKEGLVEPEFCLEYKTDGVEKEFCEIQDEKRELLGVTMGIPKTSIATEGLKMYGSLLKEYTVSFVGIIINLEVSSLNGPVGVLDAVQESVPVWNEFLIMMITINVALGVANLLFPLTITDGGRIIVDLVAWARGKQSINIKYLNVISVVLIFALFATTTVLDIQRILEKIGWL